MAFIQLALIIIRATCLLPYVCLQVELHYLLEIAKALLLRETIEVAQHVKEEAASIRRSQTQVRQIKFLH